MDMLTINRWVGPRQVEGRRSVSWDVNTAVYIQFAKQAADAKAELEAKKAKMAAAGMRVTNSLHGY